MGFYCRQYDTFGLFENALLITSETYSRWYHTLDKSVTTIFGDGAALLYSFYKRYTWNRSFIFGTDGKGFKNLTVPYSGSHKSSHKNDELKEFIDESGNVRTLANLFMNGPELFRFAISTVPSMVENLLSISKESIEKIDKFVFHQANSYMLKIYKNIGYTRP